jgi:hypothetical protein
MERVCFLGRVKPERLAEYRERPGLTARRRYWGKVNGKWR